MATRAVHHHRALRPVLAAALAACSACKVSHETLYSTPLDTVLSYQSAFAQDDGEAEYRCLSRRLKRAGGLEGYSLMRERFFEPLGSLGRFVLRRNSLDDNLRGRASQPSGSVLVFEIVRRDFSVWLTQEDVLRLEFADGSEATGAPRLEVRDGQWLVHTELSASALRRLEQQGASRLTLEAPWRIDDLQPGEPENLALDRGSGRGQAQTAQRMTLRELHWEPGEESLGSVAICFTLPSPASARRPIEWSMAPDL